MNKNKEIKKFWIQIISWGCLHDVLLDSHFVVNDFEFQSHYYVLFWANTLGKGMNPLIPPVMG